MVSAASSQQIQQDRKDQQEDQQTSATSSRRTKMQQVLRGKLSFEPREAGGVHIYLTVDGHRKDNIVYEHNPEVLVRAFQEVIPNISEGQTNEGDALLLAAINLTCLSAYATIGKKLREILKPDSIARSNADNFVTALTELQEKLKYAVNTNLHALHKHFGSDYAEDYVDHSDTSQPSKAFLEALRFEISKSVLDSEKQDAAYLHFSLRVEAVLKHMNANYLGRKLVLDEIFETAKIFATENNSADVGANFIKANIIDMALTLPKGHRGSLTDRLTNAENFRRINTNYAGALMLVAAADRGFYAALPVSDKILGMRNLPEYFKNIRLELTEVEQRCSVNFDDIKKVFLNLQSHGDRVQFLNHLRTKPLSFILYLKSGLPVVAVQDFIANLGNKKIFSIESKNDSIVIKSNRTASANATLVDVVGHIIHQASPEFLAQHSAADTSLATMIPQINNELYFTRFLNLFANKTVQVEQHFLELFEAFKAGQSAEVNAILDSIEAQNKVSY